MSSFEEKQMMLVSQILIYVHAALGGIALLTGAVIIVIRKGGKWHKQLGKFFFYTMVLSVLVAMSVAVMPGHYNPFLLGIGVFSLYLLITGLRSVRFKDKTSLKTDRLLGYGIILASPVMVIYPIIAYGKLNLIMLLFGVGGAVFGIRDLFSFRDKNRLKKVWLKLHVGKMMGGYISAVTAFFVVSNVLPGLWNWFLPTLIGSGYITYWMNKLNQ